MQIRTHKKYIGRNIYARAGRTPSLPPRNPLQNTNTNINTNKNTNTKANTNTQKIHWEEYICKGQAHT